MKSMFFSKIIWAVDALESAENHAHALYLLGALTRPTGAQIEPVYVLSPPYAHVNAEPPPDFELAFRALAEKRLLELKRTSDLASLGSGKIIVDRVGSTRKKAQCLIDYAKSENADAIVVATHGRKGLGRLFLGSFAETLLLHSTVPIFTVNLETKERERISKVLLPTTFQSRYRAGFERVVGLARALEAQLTLFYKEPIIPGSYMSPEIYRYIEQESKNRMATAKEWQGWASHYDVATDINIDNQPGYVDTAIDEMATKENFDLIAVISEADAVSAVISGSTARSVVRQSACPVWVTRTSINE